MARPKLPPLSKECQAQLDKIWTLAGKGVVSGQELMDARRIPTLFEGRTLAMALSWLLTEQPRGGQLQRATGIRAAQFNQSVDVIKRRLSGNSDLRTWAATIVEEAQLVWPEDWPPLQ